MGASLAGLITYLGSSGIGTAAATAAGTAAAGFGLSELTKPKIPNIQIPAPPGAALIDPAGQAAAASARQRAAASGGLSSTITGAGAPGTGATSGGKTLLGA